MKTSDSRQQAPSSFSRGALLFKRVLHSVLWLAAGLLRWRAKYFPRSSVLYAGQAYYHPWYLSRALRERGWTADVLNWDRDPETQIYYHGEDFGFHWAGLREQLQFYVRALWEYDVFHFSNVSGIGFGWEIAKWFRTYVGEAAEVRLLKSCGKKVVYTNNGCHDGVSQTSFSSWGPQSVCSTCKWRTVPQICSDETNLAWGRFRNEIADYQCLIGGNRIDYNNDPTVHEVPEFYCLDPEFWRPDLDIPDDFRLPAIPGLVRLFHAVGHFEVRTDEVGVNLKSTHVYVPLVERLKREGFPVEMVFYSKVPNRQLRFYQAQADIFLDMLTYGWFGATAREAMMLGKPVVCYIRPEWLESLRREIPDYAAELPIVSATPDTVEEVLRDLIANPEKRREIGARGRAFALKWHSADAGGRRFNDIYSELLGINRGG